MKTEQTQKNEEKLDDMFSQLTEFRLLVLAAQIWIGCLILKIISSQLLFRNFFKLYYMT